MSDEPKGKTVSEQLDEIMKDMNKECVQTYVDTKYPERQGWRCPVCGRGCAPWLLTCPCQPEPVYPPLAPYYPKPPSFPAEIPYPSWPTTPCPWVVYGAHTKS